MGEQTTRSDQRYRVLVAKPGLDSHDRGIRVLASELMRNGFEVIYTGVCMAPEAIARAAVDEDVDTICLSMHVGAHVAMTTKVVRELTALDGQDIPVLCGGVIPVRDYDTLTAIGAAGILPPRASLVDSVDGIRQQCRAHRERSGNFADDEESVQ